MQSEMTVGMGVRLSRSEARKLEELARRTGRSKGAVLRVLLRLADARNESDLTLIRKEARQLEREAGNG
jgi:predicted transcriptional regulator